jgi:hypothetical protein
MKFGKLTKQAKKFVDERGGTEALSAEAKNLQSILKGKGSLSDKAKQAAASAKDFSMSTPQDKRTATGEPAAASERAAPAPKPADAAAAPPAFDDEAT